MATLLRTHRLFALLAAVLVLGGAGALSAVALHRHAETEQACKAGEDGAARDEAAREAECGEQGLVAFARGKRNAVQRRLPVAVVKEKVGGGSGEASREIRNGPAQQQVDQRAYPRSYVEASKALAGRRAYVAKPSRLPSTAFPGRSTRAGRAALSTAWEQLGPITPAVPAQVTYTGAPTTNSGRVTAEAIDPTCGQPGKGCRLWIAAAGGGVFRTDDAQAATVQWTPSSAGLTTGALGSLIVDPTDATGNTLYAGSGEPNGSSDSEAGVGLFKSTDGGATWALVPGSPAAARDRSIASIVVDPTNAQHLLIGTALARHGSSSSNGGRRTPPDAPRMGVYESTDGGQAFALAFSQAADSDLTPDPTPDGGDLFTGGVNHVQLDPADPGVVYAAVEGYGIFRRPAGGDNDTWEQVFATKYPADSVQTDDFPPDSAGDRTEFDLTRVGAGAGAHTRMYVGDSSDDNGYSALFRTDQADQPAANLVTAATATTNATNTVAAGRYVSLSDPDIANTNGFTSNFFCHTQCGYDSFVRVAPDDPDTVYLGGSMNYDEIFGAKDVTPGRTNGRAVVRSTNAGVSFTDMTNEPRPTITDDPASAPDQRAEGMHPDQHALVFDPANPQRVFVGSDGGVVRTSGAFADDRARCDARQAAQPATGAVGVRFTAAELALCHQALSAVPTEIDALNDGLSTLQFQSLSVNPDKPLDDVIGGTQDNGTWAFTGSPAWFESIGGDGGQSVIQPTGGFRLHTYFGASMDINRNANDPESWDYVSEPLDNASTFYGGTEAFSFYIPLVGDPKAPETAFTAGEWVWRTQDAGGAREHLDRDCRETAFLIGDPNRTEPCGDWQRIGGAKGGHIGTAANYVVALQRAPSDAGTLWVGRRRGGLFITSNADAPGKNDVAFTDITGDTPDRFVSSITVDPADPNHAWVSYSGYGSYTTAGLLRGHVYEVRYDPAARKATYVDRSYDLGDAPVTGIARDDATGDLYAANDFGVLRLPSGATAWERAADGLPIVAVYGLTISTRGRVLYAATHGRGAYRVALPALAPTGTGGATGPGTGGGDTPGEPPANGGTPTTTTTPPSVTPAAATRIGKVKLRLTRNRSGRRVIRLSYGLANTTSVTLTLYDQRGKRLTASTRRIAKAATYVTSLKATPRTRITSKTLWRVQVLATGKAGRTAKTLVFAP